MDEPQLCPFIERRDARCGERLTLERLGEAFKLCAGRHGACPIYHDLHFEDRQQRVWRQAAWQPRSANVPAGDLCSA